MNAQARARLQAWIHRPRGSLGWIVAVVVWLVAASSYLALGPYWRLPMRAPAVLMTVLALSVALGWAVQRGVKRSVGKAIFTGQETGWQARLAVLRAMTRESNILLGTLLLMALLGVGTVWLAGRSVAHIVEDCQANLLAQVHTPEREKLGTLVGKPVCTCLAQTFLDRNGVLRLALFKTPMQGMGDLNALTPADEQRCLERFDLMPENARPASP